MDSRKKKWKINKIANKARKNFESLDFKTKEKIIERFKRLQSNPFGGHVKKVKGQKNHYRERSQKYRLYFRLNPESKTIEITLFAYRGQIKKKTIQRLK